MVLKNWLPHLCGSIVLALSSVTSVDAADEASQCHNLDVTTEVSGENRNIVTVHFGELSWSSGVLYDQIRCDDDLTLGQDQRYVSIRHGDNLDLFWFVGVSDQELHPLFVALRDGRDLPITHNPQGPLVTLGVNGDAWIQYCFDGSRWTSSEIHRSQDDPGESLSCGDDAISFFNAYDVEYTPPRIIMLPAPG